VALLAFNMATLLIGSARADEITLAAGAGFHRPIRDIAAAFEAASSHRLLQVYGHLGQVFAQIRESGRISIVCGDRTTLQSAQGMTFARMVHLGYGRLVIVHRKGLVLTDAKGIAKAEFGRIGIPDQTQSVYGRAGRQFLDRSGLAGQVDAKLVPVATVPQLTSYLASGELDAGFITATDAIGAGSRVGGFVEVDADLYTPVEIVCAVTATADRPQLAAAFIDFLATDPVRSILARYGL
jgi:molybdate transport system substrate-binding protein